MMPIFIGLCILYALQTACVIYIKLFPCLISKQLEQSLLHIIILQLHIVHFAHIFYPSL